MQYWGCLLRVSVVLMCVPTIVASLLAASLAIAHDMNVVPGQRVGPVTAYSSLNTLQALFGKANVAPGKLPIGRGETVDGARICPGTESEFHVIWHPSGIGQRISSVRLVGKAWQLDNGLHAGLTLADVEKINGKDFKLYGFDWEGGGYATFENGTLQKGVIIRFKPTEADYSKDLNGNKLIPSTSATLRAANPLVSEVTIVFDL